MLKVTDKYDQVIDGKMMNCYLKNGLKLEDVTIKPKLVYIKSEWLSLYIELNVKKRDKAKADRDNFGVVFFNLKNDAIYGKTIEILYNRQDVESDIDVGTYIKLVGLGCRI